MIGAPFDIFPLKITTSQALLAFVGQPVGDHASRILFGYLHHHGITITCLVEGPGGGEHRTLLLVISEGALHEAERELQALRTAIEAKALMIEKPVAVIRILGPHFDIRPGIAGMLYGRLEKAGIEVLVNSTTGTTSLLVVHETQLEKTRRELTAIFRLPKSR
ncbi:MAG: hypothetical protein GX422_06010 [Deltaproteobacteria bacterium]|jgi:aspartokinase|nr:hypothetical protein [Deltaproteobacteria bacterium]